MCAMTISAERLLNAWCVFINLAGIAANLLVTLATYRFHDPGLKAYSTLIRITAAITSVLALSVCLGGIGVLTVGSHTFFFSRSVAGYASPFVQDVVNMLKMVAVLWCNSLSPITFFFRYCIVVRQLTLSVMQLGLLTSIGMVQGLILAVGFYKVETQTSNERPDLTAVLMSTELLSDDVTYFRVTIPERGGFFVVAMAFIVFNLAISVFFGVKILAYIHRQKRLMSLESKAFQTRMNVTFIMQASYPLLLMLTIFAIDMMPYFETRFSAIPYVFHGLSSTIPLVDGVTLFVVIPSFRHAIFGKKSVGRTPSSAINTSRLS